MTTVKKNQKKLSKGLAKTRLFVPFKIKYDVLIEQGEKL